jgi:hypothetical protein
MVKGAAIVVFLIGFAAFLAYKFLSRHARRGWKAAQAAAEAIDTTRGPRIPRKGARTAASYSADLHYHADDDEPAR